MKEIVTAGIDIGGTNTKIGIIDQKGNNLASQAIKTDLKIGFPAFIEQICNVIKRLVPEKNQIAAIGIGTPGTIPFKGTIEFASNLGIVQEINIISLFQNHYPVPVRLANDANAAAVGELMFGGAKGMKDFSIVTLGTGLGCGIVANGELVQGTNGFAGELGHVIADPQGRYCQCGRRGCLETYASATGIRRTVYKLLADHFEDSELRKVSPDKLSAYMIAEAALKGDKIAIEAFRYTGEILGSRLSDLILLTDPEAIFLFGGLTQAGKLLFEPTHLYMEQSLLKTYKNKVKLLPSQLSEENVAVLGASALAWQAITQN